MVIFIENYVNYFIDKVIISTNNLGSWLITIYLGQTPFLQGLKTSIICSLLNQRSISTIRLEEQITIALTGECAWYP